MRTQSGERDAELELRAAIGGQKAAVEREGSDAFHQRAEEFRAAMKGDLQRVAERAREQMIFDHLHRHLRERHRVLVIAAAIARHVEHTDHLAVRVEDRHARAREEPVGRQIVLIAMDDRCAALGQRRTDGVRALAVFGPVRARTKRDLFRALKEIVVADRMEDEAVRIRQHDHALRIDDLLVQRFHDGQGMRRQYAVLFQLEREVGTGQHVVVGLRARVQAETFRAFVRFLYARGQPAAFAVRERARGVTGVVRHCLLH